jgi:hypothetical protein
MNQEIYLIFLSLLGLTIHQLKSYENARKNDSTYDLKKSIPTIILSAVTSSLLVHLRNDIGDLFVITPFSAVVLGYFGNSVFFSFVDAKKPKDV